MLKADGPYPLLRAVCNNRKVRVAQLAVWANCTTVSMQKKLSAKSDFWLHEALAIKTGLGTRESLENLFKKN